MSLLPENASLISNCGGKGCKCPVDGVNAVMYEVGHAGRGWVKDIRYALFFCLSLTVATVAF